MKRISVILLTLAIATLAALLAAHRAGAISREEDIIRDLTPLFGPPSTYPPNPGVRPSTVLNGERNGNGVQNNAGPSRIVLPEPLQQDTGPSATSRLDRVPARAFPWILALGEGERPPTQGFVCTATLIAPQWAVTAAHCVFHMARRWPGNPAPYVLARTGVLARPGPKFAVSRIVLHPEFNSRTLQNDIALLKIDTNGGSLGPPIQLEGPPAPTRRADIANVLGWGITNAKVATGSDLEALQALQVVVRGDTCFAEANYPRLKGTGVFCASSLLEYHDTCYRFGGSPLYLRDDKGARYLLGLVSWPARCPPEIDRTTPYTDVQFYVPWIKQAIAANGGGEP